MSAQAKAAWRPTALAQRSWGILAILGLYLALPLVVSPVHEMALNDDWIYAGSVKLFLETGQLKIPDMSGGANVLTQTVWGTLFAALGGGFSFTALRLSSLAAGLVATLALYSLLRQVGLGQRRSFLGAALFALNPLVFHLSYTFMTEMALLATSLLSILFYWRGLAGGRGRDLLLGALFSFAAIWVRHQALLIPVGVILYAAARGQLWRSPRLLVAVAAPMVLGLASYLAYVALRGQPPLYAAHFDMSYFVLTQLPIIYLKDVVNHVFFAVEYLGIFLSPLAIGLLASGRLWPAGKGRLGLWLALWGSLMVGGVVYYTSKGMTMPYAENLITPQGLGPSKGVLLGERALFFPDWVWVVVTGVASLGSIYLATLFSLRVGQGRAFWGSGAGFVALQGALQGAWAILAPSTFLDRSLVLMLPAAVVVALEATQGLSLSTAAVGLGVAVLGLYSVVGTQDYLAWNQARWDTARSLVAEGIPLSQIDGGIEWDGWHWFDVRAAHPELKAIWMYGWHYYRLNAEVVARMGDEAPPPDMWAFPWLPFAGESLDPVYILSFSPKAIFETWRAVDYPAALGRPGRLYVLKRPDGVTFSKPSAEALSRGW